MLLYLLRFTGGWQFVDASGLSTYAIS